jgi:hypothetical protein
LKLALAQVELFIHHFPAFKRIPALLLIAPFTHCIWLVFLQYLVQ